jgi:hypothetical protein
VLNYRKANPDYPHQSTADQWFDEAQFESYRALGYHITKAALAQAAAASSRAGGGHDVAQLCDCLLREHGVAVASVPVVPVVPAAPVAEMRDQFR